MSDDGDDLAVVLAAEDIALLGVESDHAASERNIRVLVHTGLLVTAAGEALISRLRDKYHEVRFFDGAAKIASGGALESAVSLIAQVEDVPRVRLACPFCSRPFASAQGRRRHLRDYHHEP